MQGNEDKLPESCGVVQQWRSGLRGNRLLDMNKHLASVFAAGRKRGVVLAAIW